MGVDEYEEEIVEKVRTPGGELDNRLLEEEYLESEKGKMNTIQVRVKGTLYAISFVWTLWRVLQVQDHLLFHMLSQKYIYSSWIHL